MSRNAVYDSHAEVVAEPKAERVCAMGAAGGVGGNGNV